MHFTETKIHGAFIVQIKEVEDERGFFARTFCVREFEQRGLNPCVVQCNISFNRKKGTLRGMHYQTAPYEEAKLVRCARGAIYDVILDLRPDSNSFCQWTAVELTEERRNMIYIPPGIAHGFQTLTDNTEVIYQMSEYYSPSHSAGVRWDDPVFNVQWPLGEVIMSERDKSYSNFVIPQTRRV